MHFALQECVGESTIFIHTRDLTYGTHICDLTLMRTFMFAFPMLYKRARFMVIPIVFPTHSHYSHSVFYTGFPHFTSYFPNLLTSIQQSSLSVYILQYINSIIFL